MKIYYQNKKGDLYYLHKKITKKGNARYFFSKKQDENVLGKIPKGYEVYENTHGQVFLRKEGLIGFSTTDVDLVIDGIKKYTKLKKFDVDIKQNKIYIYTPNLDLEKIDGVLSISIGAETMELNDFQSGNLTYSPVIKFSLCNENPDYKYVMEKNIGGENICQWEFVDYSNDLAELIGKYSNILEDNIYHNLLFMFEDELNEN